MHAVPLTKKRMNSALLAETSAGDATASWWWRSWVGRWLLLTVLWVAVAGVFTAQQAIGRELDWRIVAGFALLDWGPWIVLSPIVLWLAERVQIDGRNWRRTVPVHLAAALATALVFEAATGLFMEQFMPRPPEGSGPRMEQRGPGPMPFGRPMPQASLPPPQSPQMPPPPQRSQPPRFVRARLTVPIYFLLVAAAHAVAYHRHSLERERRALSAEARLAEARLMALQTQIQPHFLFNTLNAISSLIFTQPQAADEMLCALSEMLRSVLAASTRREVSLAEELAFTDRYLSIQQIRFADRLEVRRAIEPGLEAAAVPMLILQPLAENAVIHGITPGSVRGVVQVSARREGDRLQLSVSDSGHGGAPLPCAADGTLEVGEHVGLANIRARLQALYGAAAHLKLTPAPEGGVVARLELPLRFLS